jgi:hypothetical protein
MFGVLVKNNVYTINVPFLGGMAFSIVGWVFRVKAMIWSSMVGFHSGGVAIVFPFKRFAIENPCCSSCVTKENGLCCRMLHVPSLWRDSLRSSFFLIVNK